MALHLLLPPYHLLRLRLFFLTGKEKEKEKQNKMSCFALHEFQLEWPTTHSRQEVKDTISVSLSAMCDFSIFCSFERLTRTGAADLSGSNMSCSLP